MTRAEILTLQRAINAATDWGLKEDGVYGPATAEGYQYYLNQQTPRNVPTPVPPGANPWWRHKVVLGLLATVLAGVTARWGVDANELKEILLKAAELAGLALAAWGAAPSQSRPVDPTLVARVGGRSVRLPSANRVPADGPPDQSNGPFGY